MTRRAVGFLLLGYCAVTSVVMADFSDELATFAASLPVENTFIVLWCVAWFGSGLGGCGLVTPARVVPPYPPTLEDNE